MSSTIANITFDCRDAEQLAAFWSAVLDRPVDEGGHRYFASIGHKDGDGGPALLFAAVPEDKVAKNRVHLDLHSDGRAAEVTRLVALGATHVADHEEWGVVWSVLRDPEGNEFCVA